MKVDIEFVEEVDKLIKYSTEMRAATGYKSGVIPNVNFLRNYVIRFKGGRLEDEYCTKE